VNATTVDRPSEAPFNEIRLALSEMVHDHMFCPPVLLADTTRHERLKGTTIAAIAPTLY
jgi:hypothetical protein